MGQLANQNLAPKTPNNREVLNRILQIISHLGNIFCKFGIIVQYKTSAVKEIVNLGQNPRLSRHRILNPNHNFHCVHYNKLRGEFKDTQG